MAIRKPKRGSELITDNKQNIKIRKGQRGGRVGIREMGMADHRGTLGHTDSDNTDIEIAKIGVICITLLSIIKTPEL